MDRCAMVLGLIAKLDIDTRLVQIFQQQADAVVRAVEAGIAFAEITGPAAMEARQVVARKLRLISGPEGDRPGGDGCVTGETSVRPYGVRIESQQ